jgi:hypothetical protein
MAIRVSWSCLLFKVAGLALCEQHDVTPPLFPSLAALTQLQGPLQTPRSKGDSHMSPRTYRVKPWSAEPEVTTAWTLGHSKAGLQQAEVSSSRLGLRVWRRAVQGLREGCMQEDVWKAGGEFKGLQQAQALHQTRHSRVDTW